MDDEIVTEVIDWGGDPESIIKEKITPKALEKLWTQLDVAEGVALDRAIEKAFTIDKRLRKDAPTTGGNTLNIFGSFDPAHLRTSLEGVKALFGGEGERERERAIEVETVEEPAVPPSKRKGVHRKGVGDEG